MSQILDEPIKGAYPGDWLEDFGGAYATSTGLCQCEKCGGRFWGNKFRVECKTCDGKKAAPDAG